MKWFPFGKKKETKAAAHLAVLEVTDDTFAVQVLKRSYKQPVLVDFWAAWCAPCRQLGPVLERLAEKAEGDWVLAKLDTEQDRRMAAKYQIRSIPAVKMFRNGRVVHEFTGALPETRVRRFVDQALAAPAPMQLFKGSEEPARRLGQIQYQLKKGNGFEAYALLKDFPDDPAAAAAERLRPLAEFLCDIEDGDGLTGVAALDKAYQAAAKALRQRDPARALAHLQTALAAGEAMDANYTTAVIEGLLALLGADHKLARQYRAEPDETVV